LKRKKKVGEKKKKKIANFSLANLPRQKLSNVANVPRQKLSDVAHLPR
jgi:hypothetical protein